MKFFKPEDAVSIGGTTGMYISIDEANAKLEREGVRVYGMFEDNRVTGTFGQVLSGHDTHQALLINIEEIAKEECDHCPKPYRKHGFHAAGCEVTKEIWICDKCGVPLKWEVKG